MRAALVALLFLAGCSGVNVADPFVARPLVGVRAFLDVTKTSHEGPEESRSVLAAALTRRLTEAGVVGQFVEGRERAQADLWLIANVRDFDDKARGTLDLEAIDPVRQRVLGRLQTDFKAGLFSDGWEAEFDAAATRFARYLAAR